MSSKKEEAIINFITEYYQRTKFYPNFREISEAVNLSSNATIYHYMKILEDKGVIIRKGDCSPQYRLINQPKDNNEWIPCTERMPENEQEVEITYTKKHYFTGEIMYKTARAFYEDGTVTTEDSSYIWHDTDDWEYDESADSYKVAEGWFERTSFTEGSGIVDMPVIAWRPLTEPYRP